MSESTKQIVIALDDDSGNEAIYVDGSLIPSEETVYAIDIVTAANDEPVQLSHLTVHLPSHPIDFPDELEELMHFVI